MVGSWCFISRKLHVSKIKALFRLSGRSGKIRAVMEGSVQCVWRKVWRRRKCRFFSDSLPTTGQMLPGVFWTLMLIINIWFKLHFDFQNLFSHSQLFDKHLLMAFIPCGGSRFVQFIFPKVLFFGRDWRWMRHFVSRYEIWWALCRWSEVIFV